MNRIPDNEFFAHSSLNGDFPDMDSTYHYWMQEKYDAARKGMILTKRCEVCGGIMLLDFCCEAVNQPSVNLLHDTKQ